MAHPRPITITTGELAVLLGAELVGEPSITLTHIGSLEDAAPGAITFIRSRKYAEGWAASRASAALVSRDVPRDGMLDQLSEGPFHTARALLVVHDADLAVIRVLDIFAARPATPAPGVHPTAFIDPGADVSPSASIGPQCTISASAVIGAGARLVASVFIGEGARVAARCTVNPHASILEQCVIGDDSIIHAGAVIGADGFGFRPGADGKSLLKIPHIGNVVIGTHVEIGANACIDRAKFGSTTIGDGTKIDNLVQIAHGCRIGRMCIICGHVGMAGSVTVGDGVIIGGGVGIADNVEIGSGAKIAAFAGVNSNVPAGAIWMGAPAGPAGEWRRTFAALRKMGKRPDRTTSP